MTQDLIPVRREDVEYFAELVRCRALSLPEPHKSQEREILTRLSAALNVPPSAEPTRLYLPPDADAAHHALDSMYSESVTGDKYMEAYELVSHFIRAAGAPSLSETTKDQAQPDLALQVSHHIAHSDKMMGEDVASHASPQVQQSDDEMPAPDEMTIELFKWLEKRDLAPTPNEEWYASDVIANLEMHEQELCDAADKAKLEARAAYDFAAIESARDHYKAKMTGYRDQLAQAQQSEGVWPPNPWHCAHKNSCMRNSRCMYVGCVHNAIPSPSPKGDQ